MKKLGAIVRDPTLLPKLPKKHTVVQEAAQAARAQFLLHRGRAALTANSSWKGPGDDDVKDANKAALVSQLSSDVTTAVSKVTTLQAAMTDATKTDMVGIDDASVDPKARYRTAYMRLFKRSPEQFRATAIVTAAWATLADDPAISDADLHELVGRRLMVVERMMWYVGAANWGDRSWKITPANEWQDGWNRIFEYPRLPVVKPFASMCYPDADGVCDVLGQMVGWTKELGGQFGHHFRVGSAAASLWSFGGDYSFSFKRGGGNDPASAVTKIFQASADFQERSLLMCDHVIQCLHLEALVRIKSKAGGTGWFTTLEAAEKPGWLAITTPNGFDDNPDPANPKILGLRTEPRFFKREKIDLEEVQAGDHVVVYNHPAYDKAKQPVNVWRLENAVVVSTSPRTLLQGHGTNPLPFTSTLPSPLKEDKGAPEPSMRRKMVRLFTGTLKEYRRAAVAENAKTNPRTSIDVGDAEATLVQRTDTGPYSKYDLSEFSATTKVLARWWICWNQDGEQNEPNIAADPAWAQQIWDHMRVELLDNGIAYFPLWLPRMTKTGPYWSGGKISDVRHVLVDPKMIPGWSWYFEKNELPDLTAAHHVAARRPKVS